MTNPTDQKQGNQGKQRIRFALERGGRYASRPGRVFTPAEFELDREMRAAFAGIEGADGTVPSDGIYKIRSKDQHPWRVLARRMIEARNAGAPKASVKLVVDVLHWWIEARLYANHSDKAA